jgi:hypothetical protein
MQMVAYRVEQGMALLARHRCYLLSLSSTKEQTIVERMNPMIIGDITVLLWQDAIDHELDGDIWMGIYLSAILKLCFVSSPIAIFHSIKICERHLCS